MPEVHVEVEETLVEDDDGRMVAGVQVTCPDCGDVQTSCGTGDASKRRAAALLRENCSMGRKNFYVLP